MLTTTVRLHDETEIEVECNSLRQKAKKSHLSDVETDVLIDHFVKTAMPLIASGRLMRSQGGNLNVTRSLKGLGYVMQIEFTTRNSRSLFARLAGLFSNR